jgi:membrane associated rhomboid family serine protease
MLLPIGDEPNSSDRTPWMNYALIGANVVVFLIVQLAGRDGQGIGALLNEYGYVPARGEWSRLITCQFMHDGFWHIAGNMLFLWIFGDNVEARLGSLGYLMAYLALGVVSTLAFAAFNAGSTVPLVGASGAISGVQGMYFVACSRHRVKLLVWFYFFIWVFRVNARLLMLVWFVMQDVIPTWIRIHAQTGGSGIAHMAHIGGFVAGLALMLALRPMVARIQLAQDAEFRRDRHYIGGRAKSGRYQRGRRRDPYRRTTPTRPPPLPRQDESGEHHGPGF